MIQTEIKRGAGPMLACALLIGAASAQGPQPDGSKIGAGAKVQVAGKMRQDGNGLKADKHSATPEYPVTWRLLDGTGAETNSAKFVVAAGDSLGLILKVANHGEAEQFYLGGAAIGGVGGKLPGSVRLAPGAESDLAIKLVKPDCSERKGSINLILSPVNTKIKYRAVFKRIVLECG